MVAIVAVVVAGASSGGDSRFRDVAPMRSSAFELAGKVTINVSLKISQQGTFSVRGAVSDSGLARGRQTVSANRARMTLTLDGKAGRIKVLVTQLCGKSKSTWSVLSGSEAYKGLSGGGKGAGRLTCSKRAAHRGVYRGTVRTPPPTAVAQPGTYRGTGFSPNLRVTFDVLADGRTITNVSVRQLIARCQPPEVEFLAPEFSDRYPLSSSGRFSITTDGYTLSGKVSDASARGSIKFDARGCKVDSMNWKATTPASPLPAVSPGRYCGFTLAGSGVCLDATRDAWVTRVRFEVNLRCFEPEVVTFKFEYIYGGALALRPDLTFSGNLSNVPLAGGGSLRFSAEGKFDDAERRVTGKGGFSKVTVVRDGTKYTCRNAVSSFSAKLGA
ncbi:MAG: hypothetical protein ACRDPV_06075 [Gaiellaceae bacterium]